MMLGNKYLWLCNYFPCKGVYKLSLTRTHFPCIGDSKVSLIRTHFPCKGDGKVSLIRSHWCRWSVIWYMLHQFTCQLRSSIIGDRSHYHDSLRYCYMIWDILFDLLHGVIWKFQWLVYFLTKSYELLDINWWP